MQPGGWGEVRAHILSCQNEACILWAQHADMICLTRCLTADLLPPFGPERRDAPIKSLSLGVFTSLIVVKHLQRLANVKLFNKISPLIWTRNPEPQRGTAVNNGAHWLAPELFTCELCFARRCLAFTSRKCTGVWTAAASAAQSRQALVSQTASGMRKTSGAVSGKRYSWTRGVWWEIHL